MLQELKQQIRTDMLHKRSLFAKENGITASKKIVANISNTLSFDKNKNFSLYYPIKDEVDISDLMFTIYDTGASACLPVIKAKGKPLVFAKWTPDTILKAKAFDILEPLLVEELVPDIMLIPLVAFDKKGARIGYGGGYYDMTIAQIKKSKPEVKLIGVAYAMQELDTIPCDANDQKLDYVITEKEIVTCRLSISMLKKDFKE